MRSVRRGLLASLGAAMLVSALTGCSVLHRSKPTGASVSVFSVKPGQCFQTPTTVKTQLSSLTRTLCNRPHTQESYAVVTFQAADGSTPSAYPGEDLLTTFAQGACGQRFGSYVGVSYLDSKLFFTYLLPSARSWQEADDHNVICFVTTTGGTLTSSVKNSKQ
jgi:hypothetical protein